MGIRREATSRLSWDGCTLAPALNGMGEGFRRSRLGSAMNMSIFDKNRFLGSHFQRFSLSPF